MKRLHILFALPLMLLVACTATSPIVGKWQNTVTDDGATVTITTDFKGDGTVKMEADTKLPTGDELKFAGDGTYTLDGDQLTASFGSFEIIGELPEKLKPMENMIKESMQDELTKSSTATVKFEGDSMISTSADGQTMTFTKVK